ncbi:MAG TPA: glycosyltransferase family 39 protein [Polyangiaceae bacterium]|nr:glycosyltransferase family 39 protein [Polyangiaceae bacterium]
MTGQDLAAGVVDGPPLDNEGRGGADRVKRDPEEPVEPTGTTRAGLQMRASDLLLVALVVLGLVCRLRDFSLPREFLFDEHHFVNNARNYLAGQADQNDHPPLGKLLIAASIALFGDNSAAWRAPALLLGAASLGLAAFAAARSFKSPRAGWIALGLCAADGFLIAYSRAALLDGYLMCVGLGLLCVVSFAASPVTALAAGALLGLALAIKFSGVALLLPILVWLAFTKGTWSKRAALIALVLVTAVSLYCGIYAFGLHTARQPATLSFVWFETKRLYLHHSELTDMKNPATSGWSTWWLPVRPLMLGYGDDMGSVRALSSLGNLVAWWSSVALSLGVIGVIAWFGLRAVLSDSGEARRASLPGALADQPLALELSSFVFQRSRGLLRTLALAVGFVAPWVLTHRDSYIYHFLPAYAALLLILAGFLAHAEVKHRAAVLWFLVALLLVAAFYAPVWSFAELAPSQLRARLFLGSWR